jgi:YVTN family beta-propeller protein
MKRRFYPRTKRLPDTATNTVISTIPVDSIPFGVAITPDGNRIYVTIDTSDTVTVIDTATSAVVANIPVALNPLGIAIKPDGTEQGQCVSYVEHH